MNENREPARRAVTLAILHKQIPPARALVCANCNAEARHYHHHLGYAEAHWLDVVALCTTCHGREHVGASKSRAIGGRTVGITLDAEIEATLDEYQRVEGTRQPHALRSLLRRGIADWRKERAFLELVRSGQKS